MDKPIKMVCWYCQQAIEFIKVPDKDWDRVHPLCKEERDEMKI